MRALVFLLALALVISSIDCCQRVKREFNNKTSNDFVDPVVFYITNHTNTKSNMILWECSIVTIPYNLNIKVYSQLYCNNILVDKDNGTGNAFVKYKCNGLGILYVWYEGILNYNSIYYSACIAPY